MVQRKSPDKLGIRADSKNYVSKTIKQSSSQHPDLRNKGGGPELKKKMKKSRSLKRSDLESLGSYPERRAKSRFDKPPTDVIVAAAAATPQKPSLIKVSDASPNYMKSTSSSNARKEHSQVSPASSKTSDSKSPTSKLSSASGHKQLRTLTKTSSLKPVRTLTKTSSMKVGRPSIKKSSGVAFYPNQNIGRSTCSSTLKDSKFPPYVVLHPGGTESEGTSVMKVCPYTYCSLNGHHHASLPPLKCFLSARRRLLRTQKSMRLKGLSPVRTRPSGERNKEIDTGQMVFNEDPPILEADLASSAISPLIEEVGLDFFVEIYAQPREETNGNDEEKVDLTVNPQVLEDISYSVNDGAESELENDSGRVAESVPDESSHSEISFEDNLEQNSDFIATEIDILMAFTEHIHKEEVQDTDHPPCFIQEETDAESYCIESESESEIPAVSELESISEATDMDWEQGQVIEPHFDSGADHSTLADGESDLISVDLHGSADPGFHDELVFKPDDIVGNCCGEVSVNGEQLQVVSRENRESFDTEFGDGHFESDGEIKTSEIDLSSEMSTKGSDISQSPTLQDHISYTKDAFEEPKEINDDHEKDDYIYSGVFSAPTEYPMEEPTADSGENHGVSEPENDFHQGHTLLRDDKQTCSADEHKSLEDESKMNQGIVPEVPYIDTEVGCQIHEPKDEGLNYKAKTSEFVDLETNQGVATSDFEQDQVLPSANVADGTEDKEQIQDANELLGIQISGFFQVFSESNQDTGNEDQQEGKYLSISCSTYSETHNDSESKTSKSSEESNERYEKMQVEDGAAIDAAETCFTADDATGAEEEKTFIKSGSQNDQQLPKICSNMKKPIRCKRPTEDSEELRKFNPREPRYLPVEPDPEAEKVDLRHQMMDERKNAEEWMLDYALQQAVTKLAPARKRKVALLVEAFETVMPLPKYESRLQHTTTFAHTRPIQACS